VVIKQLKEIYQFSTLSLFFKFFDQCDWPHSDNEYFTYYCTVLNTDHLLDLLLYLTKEFHHIYVFFAFDEALKIVGDCINLLDLSLVQSINEKLFACCSFLNCQYFEGLLN